MPAMPASFSTVIEEQAIPETESVPMEPSETDSSVEQPNPAPVPVEKSAVEELTAEEPPSKPTETAPPANAPSHWNTGEVAVQVHRPTQKKKPWIQPPGDVEQAPVPHPCSGARGIVRNTLGSNTGVEVGSRRSGELLPSLKRSCLRAKRDRPDWMQASDAITFDAPA